MTREKKIRQCLRRFSRERVNRFMGRFNEIIAFYELAPSFSTAAEHRDQLQRLLASTRRYLDEFNASGALVPYREGNRESDIGIMMRAIEKPGSFEQLVQNYENKQKRNVDIDPATKRAPSAKYITRFLAKFDESRQPSFYRAAVAVRNALQLVEDELQQQIKSISVRRGRSNAKAAELLTEVARAYELLLDAKVVSTENSTFFQLAILITGQRDPSRAVRMAVRRARDGRNCTAD